MGGLSLFDDPDAATAARDAAIEQVAERDVNGPAQALADAYVNVVGKYLIDGFTSQDVLDYIERLDPDCGRAVAKEPRVLGAVMRGLSSRGLAYATNTYRNSGRVKNHHRPQRVWLAAQTEGAQ